MILSRGLEPTGWETKSFTSADSDLKRPIAHDRITQTKPNLEN